MKQDIYEMIAQNIINDEGYSFQDSIEPLIEEISEALNLGTLIDDTLNRTRNDPEKSRYQQIVSKVKYCEHLDSVMQECENYDSKYASQVMKHLEGNIAGKEGQFREHHQKSLEDLKKLSATISDVAYLAVYALDRMYGWQGERDGDPEEALKRDFIREGKDHPNTKVLLCALEILDHSLGMYTGYDSRILSLRESVEENMAGLKKEQEPHVEDASTAASSGGIRPRTEVEVVESVVQGVFDNLLDPRGGR